MPFDPNTATLEKSFDPSTAILEGDSGHISMNLWQSFVRSVANPIPGTSFATQYYAHGGPFNPNAIAEANKTMSPIETARAETFPSQVAEIAGMVPSAIGLSNPFIRGANALPVVSKLGFMNPILNNPIVRGAAGWAGFQGARAAAGGQPENIIPETAQGLGQGLAFGAGGKAMSSLTSRAMQPLVNSFNPMIQKAGNIINKAGTGIGQAAVAGAIAPEGQKESNAFVAGGLGILNPIVSKSSQPLDAQIRNIVTETMNRAIRPSTIGKNVSYGQRQQFDNNAISAVKDIVVNKGNHEFVGTDGLHKENILPNDIKDFAQ